MPRITFSRRLRDPINANTGPHHTDRWAAFVWGNIVAATVGLISMVHTAAKHEFVRKAE